MSTAIALRDLRKVYGDVAAVDRVDVEIADGEFFSLIGPSGCGKTTTLRMIAGLVDPTEGVIEVHGRDVTTLRPHKRPVNTVFQQYALFPHLTIFDNVAFGLQERKVGQGRDRDARRRDARARGPDGARRGQAGAALRRPAAARRARPRARAEPRGPAARRAARRAGPQAAQAAAAAAQAHPARGRHHVRLRDARPGGGVLHVRPRGDHARRAHRAARARRATSTSGRRPSSSRTSSASPTAAPVGSRRVESDGRYAVERAGPGRDPVRAASRASPRASTSRSSSGPESVLHRARRAAGWTTVPAQVARRRVHGAARLLRRGDAGRRRR